jgi:aminoglycoside phosphotransferase
MNPHAGTDDDQALRWCEAALGPVEVIADHTRDHPGLRAGVRRLRARGGEYCVKVHHDAKHFASEAHGYARWAPAFGAYAPRLIAVREEAPRAVLISALPGRIMEGISLPVAQERAAWRAAGAALASLHVVPAGAYFGQCLRDGVRAGALVTDAREYLEAEFDGWLARGRRSRCLDADELAIAREARGLIAAFADEQPTACHRDYCPANWLIADGVWAGVIDFEFAYWDVRAADFSRQPEWQWVDRPDLVEAFDEGYAGLLQPPALPQKLLSRALYALAAIVWGRENDYRGFEREGRGGLRHVARQFSNPRVS